MTERAWAAVRGTVEQLVRTTREGDGFLNPTDLVPLLLALGMPTDAGPPKRPSTWINTKNGYAWWVTPAGQTDPAKADVWMAPLKHDGEPDYTAVIHPHEASHWEGFPWEGREPTATEIHALKAHVVAALGFLSGGPAGADPLTEAADKMRDHIRKLAEAIKPVDNDHLNAEYSNGVRNATGGVMGDFAGGFNPDVAGYTSDLLTAVATDADMDTIRRLAGLIGQSYLNARQGDEHRRY